MSKSFNEYEIVKILCSGGIGKVYPAKNKKLNRHVVVKILNEKFSHHASNQHRFLQKARFTYALNQPNI